MAAVLPTTTNSPQRWQLLQRDHHHLAAASVFQLCHLRREELLNDTQLKLDLGQLAIGDGGRWLPAERVAILLSDAKTRAVVKRFGHKGEVDSTWNMLCKVKYCFHFSPVHSVEVMFLVAMKRAFVTFGFHD